MSKTKLSWRRSIGSGCLPGSGLLGRHCYCPADSRRGSGCKERTLLERESIWVASSFSFVRTGVVPSPALSYKIDNDEMLTSIGITDASMFLYFLTCLIP